MDRKRRTVERYLKMTKHLRSREEEQRVEKEARARKAGRKKRPGRGGHDWLEEADELFDTERIPRSPVYHGKGRGTPAGEPEPEPHGERADVDQLADAALVLELAPGRAHLWHGGERRRAVLSRELARHQQNRLAVGDLVELEEREGAEPRVMTVLPRRGTLSRPDPGHPDRERVIAANVDLALVVIAAREPAFRRRLIDRYLVALQRGGVEPVVCVSKADLLEEAPEIRENIEQVLEELHGLGVMAVFTSTDGVGLEQVREAISGRTVVLVGQSGVGKSSLLNALAPELGLVTGKVRGGDGKGRHTTTSSSLHELEGGTRVIDTPGVRGFGLWGISRRELGEYFPEFEHVPRCRFTDCSHRHEPSCGVREGAEQGLVTRARYEAYLRLWESLEPG